MRDRCFRKQLEELGPAEKIRAFKRLIASALSSISSKSNVGAIVDERYGEQALFALTRNGMWLARPVEVPGSRPPELEVGGDIAGEVGRTRSG